MQLSRKADYALRAVRHLTNVPKGKLASINAIAEAEQIPREFLAKILKDLTRAGVLVKDVSFLDVIEAIEGPIHINLCTEGGRCSCEQVGTCTMHDFWVNQEAMFKKALGKHSFGKYKKARA
jgi:Rrf2 family iron-sulfur cluster assembly transcriptional regulator